MVEKIPKNITIQDLYPDLSPEEQEEAKDHLRQYMNLVWRIYERLKREGKLEELLNRHRLRTEWEKRSTKEK